MMNCSCCETPNVEEAKFCKNCGANLYPVAGQQPISKASDTLLIIFIVTLAISGLTRYFLEKTFTRTYADHTSLILIVFFISNSLSYLLLPFAIQNKTWKMIGIVTSVLLIIYWNYAYLKLLFR